MVAFSLLRSAHRRLPGCPGVEGDSGDTGNLEAWSGFFLVPVALASLSLLQEGPYQGVHNVRLVLLQPVASPGDDVETEVVADVEAARLGHFLLQERVPLPPQQQHRRPNVVLAQRERTVGKKVLEFLTFFKFSCIRFHFPQWKTFFLPKTSLTFTNDVPLSILNILPVVTLTVALTLGVPSCFLRLLLLGLFHAICGSYFNQRNADRSYHLSVN